MITCSGIKQKHYYIIIFRYLTFFQDKIWQLVLYVTDFRTVNNLDEVRSDFEIFR